MLFVVLRCSSAEITIIILFSSLIVREECLSFSIFRRKTAPKTADIIRRSLEICLQIKLENWQKFWYYQDQHEPISVTKLFGFFFFETNRFFNRTFGRKGELQKSCSYIFWNTLFPFVTFHDNVKYQNLFEKKLQKRKSLFICEQVFLGKCLVEKNGSINSGIVPKIIRGKEFLWNLENVHRFMKSKDKSQESRSLVFFSDCLVFLFRWAKPKKSKKSDVDISRFSESSWNDFSDQVRCSFDKTRVSNNVLSCSTTTFDNETSLSYCWLDVFSVKLDLVR